MAERGQTLAQASQTTHCGGQGSDPVYRPAGSDPRQDRLLHRAQSMGSAPAAGAQGLTPSSRPPSLRRQSRWRPHTPVRVTTGKIEEIDGVVRLSQSFVLEHPREAVWTLMSDPEAVARCMPGAYLDGPPQDGRLKGRIEVKLGPVAASFAGEGTVTPYPAEYRQVIEGRGVDRKGGSRVSGSVDYRLSENRRRRGHARRCGHQLRPDGPAGPARPVGPRPRSRPAHRRGIRAEHRRPAAPGFGTPPRPRSG